MKSMPLPKAVTVFNKYVINKFFLFFAAWFKPMAIVVHSGRRSGRLYYTPVMVFRTGNGFLFALTYGSDVDWVKNLKASNNGILRYGGKEFHIQDFRLVEYREVKQYFPLIVRVFLNIIRVRDCLESDS
jgi:deazaflavin-dependent oxidoreductase (nitroreductase family)